MPSLYLHQIATDVCTTVFINGVSALAEVAKKVSNYQEDSLKKTKKDKGGGKAIQSMPKKI